METTWDSKDCCRSTTQLLARGSWKNQGVCRLGYAACIFFLACVGCALLRVCGQRASFIGRLDGRVSTLSRASDLTLCFRNGRHKLCQYLNIGERFSTNKCGMFAGRTLLCFDNKIAVCFAAPGFFPQHNRVFFVFCSNTVPFSV